MDEIQKLLIIGNGFDLSMGLKTSYNDFMGWLNGNKEVQDSYLYKHLKRKIESQRWVDIEDELRHYSSSILQEPLMTDDRQRYVIKETRGGFRHEYLCLCTWLREYLIEQQRGANKENMFYSKAMEVLRSLQPLDHGFLNVISFNYTNIIDHEQRTKVHHVHGSLDKEGFVFGIEDGEDVHKDHLFLYKSHNPYLAVNHLNERFDDAGHISFFGYSLGQTDHSYFDDFFKQQSTAGCKRKKFEFYYYGQDAYDDLYWQLRILTDKRVAKFKQFNDVEFIKIKKEGESV